MTVLYFGFYDPLFTTNKVLINGLRQNGVLVLECYDHSPGLKKFLKLFFKHWKLRNEYDAMIIGFAGQLAVPFAKIITRKPVIFSGQRPGGRGLDLPYISFSPFQRGCVPG